MVLLYVANPLRKLNIDREVLFIEVYLKSAIQGISFCTAKFDNPHSKHYCYSTNHES